jgi:hypothetical protein
VLQSRLVVDGQRRSAWPYGSTCRIPVELSTTPTQVCVEIHAQSRKKDDLDFEAHLHSSENIAFSTLTQSNTCGRDRVVELVKIE